MNNPQTPSPPAPSPSPLTRTPPNPTQPHPPNLPPLLQFFDDMHWNIEDCSGLGVCSVYAPRGLRADVWSKGLAEYARRQGS